MYYKENIESHFIWYYKKEMCFKKMFRIKKNYKIKNI